MDKTATARQFLTLLSDTPVDTAALTAMLTPEPILQSTSGNSSGMQAFLGRMTDGPGRVFRESKWSEPELTGETVKVVGVAPGAGGGSPILVFHFDGDRISMIQHQFYTARQPGTGTAIKLPQEVKDKVRRSLAERHPMVVAYVDERGAPVLSFRGSVQAVSDSALAFWSRPESRLTEAVKTNPYVSLIYRNEDTHEGFQFQGRARIATDPAEIKQVYENTDDIERERDMAKLGVAVIVELDRVEGAIVRLKRESEPIRMERNEA
jgi:general stress protein 26